MRRTIVFALATIVPLALIHGAIEFTSTLWFGPGGAVRDPENTVVTAAMREADVLRAIGLTLAFHVGTQLSLGAPFVSLTKSYAGPDAARLALEIVLRKGFWLALPWTVLSLTAWLLPESASMHTQNVFLAVLLVSYVVLIRTLKSFAEAQPGVTPSLAWVIVVVSLLAHIVLSGLIAKGLAAFLPPSRVAVSLWPAGDPLTYLLS